MMNFDQRINGFQDDIKTCSERTLFNIIEEIGETIWITDHEIYHGRISAADVAEQREVLQALIEDAVREVGRFGVEIDIEAPGGEEYRSWYKRMKYGELDITREGES